MGCGCGSSSKDFGNQSKNPMEHGGATLPRDRQKTGLDILALGHSTCTQAGARTWIWQGALMPTSIRFSVKTDEVEQEFRIVAATEGHSNLSFARLLPKSAFKYSDLLDRVAASEEDGEEKFFNNSAARSFQMLMEGLDPNTTYHWSAGSGLTGRFRTPPPLGARFNFTFAFASCADNDSDHVLFSMIPENQSPLFFIHTGDLHYGNLHRDEFFDYARMLDRTLLRPNQGLLYRNLPTVYMWDDHDYGPNNASVIHLQRSPPQGSQANAVLYRDKFNPGRDAAMKAYRMLVPSYQLATKRPDGAVYHSFTVGRILFVVTDTSSERVHDDKTTLGEEQLQWLLNRIRSVATRPGEFAAMVWVTTMPWVDEHYKWGEFSEERSKIGAVIRELNLADRIIIVSGDAHMVAVDDGTHSVGGVKVFQAAALDAKPTTKGGPFSHGVWPGRNQYGTMEVRDMEDGRICFVFHGWRWKRDKAIVRLVKFDTCDLSQNVPFLYQPSPLFVQKTWKRVKKLLEESDMKILKALVGYIDSTRLTTAIITNPYFVFMLASLPLIFSSLRIAIKAVWQLVANR